jgi:DNA-binding NarL/FixJ family response regulator
VERTRIVLVDMSPLLRDIVRNAIAHEPDLEVVAEHDGNVDLETAVERGGADFVILGSEVTAHTTAASLVASNCRVRALELQDDGREGVLYEFRPHRVALGELSPDTLLRTIRAVPSWDAGP